ncbi:MAG: MlaD family protein [Bacteroidales bacterium]
MKTIINRLFTFFIILALLCCTKKNTLKIEFDNVAGLDNKSPVLIGGLKVGNINEFNLQPNSKVIVDVKFEKNVLISEDAKFIISSIDILGSKGLTIENGKSNSSIDYNLVHKGQNEKSPFSDSTVVNIINKFLSKFTTTSKLDSIKNDLIKLNKNIEKLNEKK